MALRKPRGDDAFEAGLSFVDPSRGTLTHCDYDRSKNAGACIVHQVPIGDARRLGETSLDREGFKLVRGPSQVTDFYDEDVLRSDYFPEAARIIQAETGATDVRVFSHNFRTESRPMEGPFRVPATFMHNDYHKQAALDELKEMLTPTEQERLLAHRYIEINLWRPIRGPVRTKPLALAAADSLGAEDFVIGLRLTADGVEHEYLAMQYRPSQRWYYYPDMQPDEALLLKCYDSDPSRLSHGAHGAMEGTATPPGAVPRETVEVRAFAFFAPD